MLVVAIVFFVRLLTSTSTTTISYTEFKTMSSDSTNYKINDVNATPSTEYSTLVVVSGTYQKLNETNANNVNEIFESIGVYLAYTLAYYAEFYNIKHVLLLGRVTSGIGGDTILKVCKEVLEKEFPEYANIDIGMPSEYMRRVGQSIAAASLPISK